MIYASHTFQYFIMASARYLLSPSAYLKRVGVVREIAEARQLAHFDFHEDKLDSTVEFVASVIKQDFDPNRYNQIGSQECWMFFQAGGIQRLQSLWAQWNASGHDDLEVTRRFVDLCFVSVLLDAGDASTGDVWKYTEPGSGNFYHSKKGIAVASLNMFSRNTFAA